MRTVMCIVVLVLLPVLATHWKKGTGVIRRTTLFTDLSFACSFPFTWGLITGISGVCRRVLHLGDSEACLSFMQFWSFCISFSKRMAAIIQINLSTKTMLMHYGANFLTTTLQVYRTVNLRRSVVAESTPTVLFAVQV